MKYVNVPAVILLALVIFAPGCAPGATTSPATVTPVATTVVQKPSGNASKAEWEKKWEATRSQAKQEGEILIYLNAPSEARIAISNAFNSQFGLKVDVIMGSAAELTTRLVSEYRAGVHQADAIMAGPTLWAGMDLQGLLSPIVPILILPEINDPKVWVDSKLPFFDKNGMVVSYLAQKIPPIIYNTDLVKEGAITSYLDLLKPEWKGKLVMFDPTIPGGANGALGRLAVEWGADKAREYLISLVQQQEVVITRDQRQQMEWVVRGKYPVAIGPQTPATIEFLKLGAPLGAASIKEKVGLGPSNGGIGIPAKPPHPNATVIFLNWFLSREGQTLGVKTMGAPSSRVDVPPVGVSPIYILQPGDKFFRQDEELSLTTGRFTDEWKKVFAQSGR